MRRQEKKEILNIIASLEQINRLTATNMNAGVPVTAEVLIDCQNAALEAGNALESLGEPVEEIIRALEEYCETLYQMSLSLDELHSCRKLAKKIQKQLSDIKNKIISGLPSGKKEVVFLPYKASMWDSLESVWQAAAEDADCDAYVVPIPYYDKKADGSLGEMHYEGGEYPDYVPVVSWKEYDIARRRPDAIYIHNPYDDWNYVTTVHPDFYAPRLRSFTDLLVYIPYFIAIDDEVEDHFCVAPGILCAHKVVVQSEKVRKRYIEELRRFEKENHCQGKFGDIEEKITALGSPKFDKVRSAKRDEYELPEEWKNQIRRPDGSVKKVIFYNTTVSSMLKQQEKMLAKIRDVFRVLQTQEDTVLLWRPHPLLKSTLRSMRPGLLAEYEQIEQEYREGGWGIFDDSPDLYRAITWSDAYYGDMSSVVELYKQTGKPVMIQNTEVLCQDEDMECGL
ncbi:MAG: hypothetical protein HFI38_01590 [Lachnospiraceae bacterium]|jgi:hypothetical protein|nr:hypothetical protein [Lachnospiraceae bacterium]